jgi:hypothetical protein
MYRASSSGRDMIGWARLTSTTDINRPIATGTAVDLGEHGHGNVASQVRPHSLDLLWSEVERWPKGPFGALCNISITTRHSAGPRIGGLV